MEDERKRILTMLQAGKVSVEEAESLLEALESGNEAALHIGQEAAGAANLEESQSKLEADLKRLREDLSRLSTFKEAAEKSGWDKLGEDLDARIEDFVTSLVDKFTGEGNDEDRKNLGQMTITAEYLLGMEDGGTLKNLGQLTLDADISEDLLRKKIGHFINLGQVRGPSRLVRVLQGRCERNLGQFREIEESVEMGKRTFITNEGTMVFSKFFLEHFADGATFVNEGLVDIVDDVPEELLLQKIGVYQNEGETRGPSRLLAILQSRCKSNEGSFIETD